MEDAVKVLELVRGIILHPQRTFLKIQRNEISGRKIHYVFWSVFIIIIIECLLMGWKRERFDVFSNVIDDIFTYLSIPLIAALTNYAIYSIFILLTTGLCRVINKNNSCLKLPQMLMSISVLGLIVQVYLVINNLLSNKLWPNEHVLHVIGYLLLCWNMFLVFLAIKTSGLLNVKRAIVVFLSVAVIFSILSPLGPWSSTQPYFFNAFGSN